MPFPVYSVSRADHNEFSEPIGEAVSEEDARAILTLWLIDNELDLYECHFTMAFDWGYWPVWEP